MSSLTTTADRRGPSELADALAAVARLEARVEAIEHRLSPSTLRREDRAALERILPALAGALGSGLFLASEAIASTNPALVLVLAGLNGRRLGRLLRRGDGVPVSGYVVHARGRETGAVLSEVLRVL